MSGCCGVKVHKVRRGNGTAASRMSIPCGSEAVAPLCSLSADEDGAGYWEVILRASPWPEIVLVPPSQSTFLQCLLSLTVRGTAAWSPCHITQPPNSFHFLPNQLPGRTEQPLQQMLGTAVGTRLRPQELQHPSASLHPFEAHLEHLTHGHKLHQDPSLLPLGSLCHHLLLSLGFQQQKLLARPLAQDELLP